ncbi:hypothetical protein BJD16_06300 [Aeromonas sobria]|uniref:Uncharacterized protein n=1 Tax=Aeromonas sobria TaxID=646 RepID=A0A1S2CJT9_AERSO|nr:hypothetical protein BJD16_06300 [Aeromonas sobria]
MIGVVDFHTVPGSYRVSILEDPLGTAYVASVDPGGTPPGVLYEIHGLRIPLRTAIEFACRWDNQGTNYGVQWGDAVGPVDSSYGSGSLSDGSPSGAGVIVEHHPPTVWNAPVTTPGFVYQQTNLQLFRGAGLLPSKVQVTYPSGSIPELQLNVTGTCETTLRDRDQGQVLYRFKASVQGAGTLPRKNDVALLVPSTITFGAIPLGGHSVRGLDVTVTADLDYTGTLRFVADSANGSAAPIGGATMRLWAQYLGGYADLSGGTEYRVTGLGGQQPQIYSHDVFIDTQHGGQLGAHRTNLRLVLKHD